jgi:hypothetical protein
MNLLLQFIILIFTKAVKSLSTTNFGVSQNYFTTTSRNDEVSMYQSLIVFPKWVLNIINDYRTISIA